MSRNVKYPKNTLISKFRFKNFYNIYFLFKLSE